MPRFKKTQLLSFILSLCCDVYIFVVMYIFSTQIDNRYHLHYLHVSHGTLPLVHVEVDPGSTQ